MKTRHLLAVGFALNMILLAAAFLQANQRLAVSDGEVMADRPEASLPAITDDREPGPPVPPGLTNVVVRREFQWSDLESDDYRTLIFNLREAGCPETTLRDIVLARVKDDYASRRWQLLRPLQAEFWDRLARGEKISRWQIPDEMESGYNALSRRAGEVLARLETELQARPEPKSEDGMELFDFLPSEKQARVKELRRQMLDQVQQQEGSDAGQRAEARRALAAEFEAALDAVLDESERAEYELRRGSGAGWLRNVKGLDLTEAEMRALALYWQTNGVNPRALDAAQLESAVAEVAGPERAAGLQQGATSAADEMFHRIARRHGLPADVASRAAEVRVTAEAEAAAIRVRTYADEETRARAAAALLAGVGAELQGIFGDPAWQTLQKYGLDWTRGLFAETQDSAP
jgi:hypothetical protein